MPRWEGEFILLKDFWSAYDSFQLKAIGLEARLEQHIVTPMEHALSSCVRNLRTIDAATLGLAFAGLAFDEYFVITMDGGSYFDQFDFSFEITRAAFRLSDVLAARFFRMARETKPMFYQQTMRIRAQYEEYGDARPILLCDDGMGTGTSVRDVLGSLAKLDLTVSQVIVLINPNGISQVDGVPVVTVFDTDVNVLWLSERDLYWGLPRSGVSFTRWDDVNPCFGLPYTIDAGLTAARVGLPLDVSRTFRADCLAINERLWILLEQLHGRNLDFSDCARLAFVPEYLRAGSTRIAGFLNEINLPDFRVMDLAKSPQMMENSDA